MTKRIKCRFCDWSTVKGYTGKDGKFKGIDKAHGRLSLHVLEKHRSEYEQIQEALGNESPDGEI